MRRLFFATVLLITGCTSEPDPSASDGRLPTSDPVTVAHVLNYLAETRPEDLPPPEVLETELETGPPARQLMLGLSLAASADRGTEAPPFLVGALAADSIEWEAHGRALVELLLRRTRAEHHHRAAKQAADAALAGERVKRQQLETTLEALRQIDRDMSEEERP